MLLKNWNSKFIVYFAKPDNDFLIYNFRRSFEGLRMIKLW